MASGEDTSGLKIGVWSVYPAELRISDGSSEQLLESKVMELLLVFAEAPGEVISRNDLIDRVWGTEFGGDESLSRAVSLLRKALGDTRGNHQHIVTIPRKGYQLVAPVSREESSAVGDTTPAQEAPEALAPRTPAETPNPSQAPETKGLQLPIPSIAIGAIVVASLIALASWMFSSPREDTVTATAPLYDPSFYLVGEFRANSDAPELTAIADDLSRDVLKYLGSASLKTGVDVPNGELSPEFVLEAEVLSDEIIYTLNRWDGGAPYWTAGLEANTMSLEELSYSAAVYPVSVISCAEDIEKYDPEASDAVIRLVFRFCDSFHKNDGRIVSIAESILEESPNSTIGQALSSFGYGFILWTGRATERDEVKYREILNTNSELVLAKDLENSAVHLAQAMALRFVDLGKMYDALEVGHTKDVFDATRLFMLGLQYRQSGQNKKALDTFKLAALHPSINARAEWYERYVELVFFDGGWSLEDLRIAELKVGLPSNEFGFFGQVLLSYRPRTESMNGMDRFIGAARDPNIRNCYETYIYTRTGDIDARARMVPACRDIDVDPASIETYFAATGFIDEAYEISQRVIKQRDLKGFMPTQYHFPIYAAYRQDPRFWEIMDGYGLLDFWLETSRWPDWCEDENLGFDCAERANAYKSGLVRSQ